MHESPIATAGGPCRSASDVDAIARSLSDKLGSQPSLLIASYSAHCDTSMLTASLRSSFPDAAIMGASTCRGAMTADGLVGFGVPSVALWGLVDDNGDYGAGFASFDAGVESAARKALEEAVRQADRAGEWPDLVWVHSSPGHEETIVATLDDLLGNDVSIVGGSAADDTLEGTWSCFADQRVANEGVAVAVFYSSFRIASSFQCGYEPTGKSGRVTRCDGRTVYELDGRPAAQVYNDWTGALVDLSTTALPVNVLGSSTLSPLGTTVGDLAGIPYFNLAHPETFTEDHAITFFCEIAEGETLTLMKGTLDNIIARPGRVAHEALSAADAAREELLGALIVFCGGCLLAVDSRASEIPEVLNTRLQGKPFLGCFTYGEQGRFSGGENRHGNLMISATVFYA